MKKVCVIGGAGFLGSHICDSLTLSEYKVTVFDQAESKFLKREQTQIIGSILDPDAVASALEDQDIVINCAGLADLDSGMESPAATVNLNILGNVNILEACVQHGVSRYVYASTMYVYSRFGGYYRCSKQAAEDYIYEFQAKNGLAYTIVRYGTLYGSRSSGENSVYRMVEDALKRQVVSFEGDLSSAREFIHIKDAALNTVALLSDAYKNQVISMIGAQRTKKVELVEILSEILGLKSEVKDGVCEGHYKNTPYSYVPKLSRKYIGDSYIDLGAGLLELIEYIKLKGEDSLG